MNKLIKSPIRARAVLGALLLIQISFCLPLDDVSAQKSTSDGQKRNQTTGQPNDQLKGRANIQSSAQVTAQVVVRERLSRTALRQAERISSDWDPGQRDCAGFVRYLYRASITSAKPLWKNRDGQSAVFLTADELIAANFEPLGRNYGRKHGRNNGRTYGHDEDRTQQRTTRQEWSTEGLKTGDVLAFFHSDKPADEAWHLMVVLDSPVRAPSRPLLIYHNGEKGREGAVRKVWLDDLVHTAEMKWRPLAGNPNFVGAFRWKGWKELNEIPHAVSR